MPIRIPNTFNEEEIRNAIRRIRSEVENIVTVETDPIFVAWQVANDNHADWDTAFGWGDHSVEGYLTSETSHADVVVDGDFTSQGIMLRGASSGAYSILADGSANWNTAYGWGDHAGLYTPLAHKTTEDALNGLVKCNGAGVYSAITDNSANWDAAGLTADSDLECLVTDGVAGGAESDPVFASWQSLYDNHADWDTAFGWGNWAHTTLAGYGITDAAPLSFKTTLDALNGFVKCDGAGNYSATISNPFAEASVVTDTTTDGTIKTIATIPVPSGGILSVKAWVIGNNSADHSIGVGTLLMCAAHNAAGTATLLGSSTNLFQGRSSSPYSASFSVSGTNVLLRVTGNAGVTMNWKAYYSSWSY